MAFSWMFYFHPRCDFCRGSLSFDDDHPKIAHGTTNPLEVGGSVGKPFSLHPEVPLVKGTTTYPWQAEGDA